MKTAPPPLAVARTDGARIVLEDGRELIDGIASWWTACHGYNHPHIRGAVQAQLERAPHVMFGGLAHEPAYRLAARLANLLPADLDHIFFAESGSVSVEIAMKMALQFWINRGVPGRTRFLAFRGGYHGDTLATMTVCDPDEGMHSLFAGVMPAQHIADLPTDAVAEAGLDTLLAEKAHEVAAILVEPRVQGAGGMLFHDDEVLRRLRRLADRHDVLLIFDEIFAGFGRTGDLFACEGAGVVPDIVTRPRRRRPLRSPQKPSDLFLRELGPMRLHVTHCPAATGEIEICTCGAASGASRRPDGRRRRRPRSAREAVGPSRLSRGL